MSLNLYDVVFARGLGGGNGGSGGGSYKGMTIHVCSSSEYDSETNIPTISEPDDQTIYLVPGDGDENNIFNEYIYVNDSWELFGSATIDLENLTVEWDNVLDKPAIQGSGDNVSVAGKLTVGSNPTSDMDVATKHYVDNGLASKQNTLTFDSTPTASSTKPVTSGGIKTALDDIEMQLTEAITVRAKTELIPNVSSAISSYGSTAVAQWYLSNRVIPEGSVIRRIRVGAKADYTNGTIVFINDEDVVVHKYSFSYVANKWQSFDINLLATENLRLAARGGFAFSSNNVSNEAAFAIGGLWSSQQGDLNVGDTLSYSQVGPYNFMFSVQWEVETYSEISDSVIAVKDERPSAGYHNFSVGVNYHDYTNDTFDGETLYTDYGVVALPANYSATGTPTKLIILCGGSGERIVADTNPLSFHGWAYYLAKGYAVMDMNGMSQSWAIAMGFPNILFHYCNKYLVDSYHKGYEYVLNKYNIDKTKVFIGGISMGGGASALLVQSGIFPVVAHCAFCPALSVYKQDYMQPWGSTAQQKTIAGQYGFTNWDTTSVFDQAYFLENIDKISGFDNLTIRAIGDIATANAHYGDVEEATAYNSMQKIYPVPVKIWHSSDDSTVLIRYSEFFVNMIKNGGGQAWLRTFPSGGHTAGWNYGSVSDTDIDNNTVTTSIPFYESVLFFKRFG